MLYFDGFAWLAGLLVLALLLVVLRRRKRSLAYLACFTLFGIYLLLVVKLTLFPIPLPASLGQVLSRQSVLFTLGHINLIPAYYGEFLNTRILVTEIVQNLLLTLPFGFGINFILRLRPRDVPWLVLTAGLGIETAQLLISLGLAGVYRSVDINDVLLNAAGGLLGYGCFRLCAAAFPGLARRLQAGII